MIMIVQVLYFVYIASTTHWLTMNMDQKYFNHVCLIRLLSKFYISKRYIFGINNTKENLFLLITKEKENKEKHDDPYKLMYGFFWLLKKKKS